MALGSMGSRVSSVVSSFHSGVIYSTKLRCLFIAQTVATKHHASVNLVYDSIASGRLVVLESGLGLESGLKSIFAGLGLGLGL